MNIKYDMDPRSIQRAVKRGLNRGRRVALLSTVSIVLVLLIAVTALSAAVSPAFADRLASLPVIGNVVRLFRPNDAIYEAFERGHGETLGLSARNDYYEVVIDEYLATKDEIMIVYRYRWLQLPEDLAMAGVTEEMLFDTGALVTIGEIRMDSWPFPMNGRGEFNDKENGWYLCYATSQGDFPHAETKIMFEFNGRDPFYDEFELYPADREYPLSLTIPLQTTPEGEEKLIPIHFETNDYIVENLRMTPITAYLTLTMKNTDPGSYDLPLTYIGSATGVIWNETSGSGNERSFEIQLESPYYSNENLTLYLVDGKAANDTALSDYHIRQNDDGAFIVPEEIEVLNAEPIDGGQRLRMRFTGELAKLRGVIASLYDESMFTVIEDGQTFEFDMMDDWDSLWLSGAFYTPESIIEIPLSKP